MNPAFHTQEDCIAFAHRVKHKVASVVQAVPALVTQTELVFRVLVALVVLLLLLLRRCRLCQ